MPDHAAEQLESETSLEMDDTGGMGLYLVRRLVDSYRGSISVAHRDPRETEVTVRLQVADGD